MRTIQSIGLYAALAVVPVLAPFALFTTGCQHSSPTAAAATVPAASAPFENVPILPGTPDVATLVAKVKPGVVNITTIHEQRVARGEQGLPFFFGGRGPGGAGNDGEDRVMRQTALGSGFLVQVSGKPYVVTNNHVIDGADTVKVKLSDDREVTAKVKGRDERLDLAVLEIDGAPGDLPTVALGSSDGTRVGEYVVAIGNPFGLGNTVTMGIVSAKGRAIGAGPYDDFIQTDASINPGNSGGPLFNLHGQVVGINTAINPNGKGIGFAIPVDMLKEVLPQLVSTGHVARGRLGVGIQPVDDDLAKAMGLPDTHGALVGQVERGGPAERAGIAAGDMIVAVDGRPVHAYNDLPRMIAAHTPGSDVTVAVIHDKQKRDLKVHLDALRDKGGEAGDDDATPAGGSGSATPSGPRIGVGLGETKDGVVVERVLPGSAAEGHLTRGDIIEEVDRKPVHSADEVMAAVKAAGGGKPLLFKVKRATEDGAVAERFIAVTPRAR